MVRIALKWKQHEEKDLDECLGKYESTMVNEDKKKKKTPWN